ncbi:MULTISPECIES: hypothetical protein [unclassified Thermoplasma]|uniref:hypothetical protein n=1 Tax=unclassified Thermoplasma TaxID=2684908 RepID=UPI000D8A562A|nr:MULTISPECIES: hypothetical protein [unclassified Thermoplasma]PYB68399.1 hypothetical protein DMB44_03400 [Thermoplasma sp. Kam2015]
MNRYYELVLVAVLSIVFTIVFLISGFWYGVIVAGFLSTVFFDLKPYLSIPVSTVASLIGLIIFEIPEISHGLFRLMYYVGSIAGISGSMLILISFLLDMLMAVAGAFIGVGTYRYSLGKRNYSNVSKH